MQTVAVQREGIFKKLPDEPFKNNINFCPSKTQNMRLTDYRKSRLLSFKKIQEKQNFSSSTQRATQISTLINQQSQNVQNKNQSFLDSQKLESPSPLKKIAANLLQVRKNGLATIDSNHEDKIRKSVEKDIKSPEFRQRFDRKIQFDRNKQPLFRKTFCSSSNQGNKNKSLEIRNIQIRPPTTNIEFHRPLTRIRKVSNIGDQSNNNFLAKYEIIKELGKGTYGTVFLAKIIKNQNKKLMNKTCFFNSFRLISHESQYLETQKIQNFKQQRGSQYINLSHKNTEQDDQKVLQNESQQTKKLQISKEQAPIQKSNEQKTDKKALIENQKNLSVVQNDNQLVAIKVYQKFKMNKDPAKFKNIRKEITIMQNLSHKGVIKLYQSVESITKISLVVQYGGNLSLLDYLRKHFPLSNQKLKNFTRQLLQTIVYIHDKNIVHRDIKPQNILVKINQNDENNQKLKLIDFGFSTLINKSRKINVICGTPNFMAPQLLNSKEYYAEKADVWSFGVVVFVMAEGRHPFKSTDYKELSRIVNKGKYTFKRKYDQSFQQFISQILKVNEQQRPTATQILKHKWLQQA